MKKSINRAKGTFTEGSFAVLSYLGYLGNGHQLRGGGGGQVKFYPYKRVGGGGQKVLAMLKGRVGAQKVLR